MQLLFSRTLKTAFDLRRQDKDTSKADYGKRPANVFACFQQCSRLLMHVSARCRKAGSRPSTGWKESEGQLGPPNPSGKKLGGDVQSFTMFPSGNPLLQLFWKRISMPVPGTARGASSYCSISLLPRLLPHQPHYPVIPGKDTTCQAKFGVVGSLHNLLLRVKWQNGHDRPKDFFLHTSHVIRAVPWKQGREHVLQEEELVAQPVHLATPTALETALSTAQPP